MSDLTESTVRGIVRGEVAGLQGEIKRLEGTLGRINSRLGELHSVQNEVHRMVSDVARMQDQIRTVPGFQPLLQQMRTTIDELRVRVQRTEESARYTAGYVAMRLKERYDSGADT